MKLDQERAAELYSETRADADLLKGLGVFCGFRENGAWVDAVPGRRESSGRPWLGSRADVSGGSTKSTETESGSQSQAVLWMLPERKDSRRGLLRDWGDAEFVKCLSYECEDSHALS